jgi:hypothetical protein
MAELDSDSIIELKDVSYWQFTGLLECRHCGRSFHWEAYKQASKAAIQALAEAAFRARFYDDCKR